MFGASGRSETVNLGQPGRYSSDFPWRFSGFQSIELKGSTKTDKWGKKSEKEMMGVATLPSTTTDHTQTHSRTANDYKRSHSNTK